MYKVRFLYGNVTRVQSKRNAKRLPREPCRFRGTTRNGNVRRKRFTVVPITIFPTTRNESGLIRRVICMGRIRRRQEIIRPSKRIVNSIITRDNRHTIVIKTTPFTRGVQRTMRRCLYAHFPKMLRRRLLPYPFQFAMEIIRYNLHKEKGRCQANVTMLLRYVGRHKNRTRIPFRGLEHVLKAIRTHRVRSGIDLFTVSVRFNEIAIRIVFMGNGFLAYGTMVANFPIASIIRLKCGIPTSGPSNTNCWSFRGLVKLSEVRGLAVTVLFALSFHTLHLFLRSRIFTSRTRFRGGLFRTLRVRTNNIVTIVILCANGVLVTFHRRLIVIRIANITKSTMMITRISDLYRLFTNCRYLVRFLTITHTSNLRLHLAMFQVGLHMYFLRNPHRCVRNNNEDLLCR